MNYFSAQIRSIIEKYRNAPVSEVVLALQKLPSEERTFIAEQINGYQKSKNKIPSFCKNNDIVFPPKLNLEQSSSELTALWKAHNIIRKAKTILDITGGFGIDAWAFSRVSEQVAYVEQNESLANIAKHNFRVLKANIEVYQDDAKHFLLHSDKADWIYADPARRDSTGKSVAQISDTQPNILELLPQIFTKTENLLIKTSPMLDLTQALRELAAVQQVWIIAVENECKELLFHLNKSLYDTSTSNDYSAIPIEAINIANNGSYTSLKANFLQETSSILTFSAPQKYLYEPNAAIMKAGFFRYIAGYFDVFKLHPHTHFYTSQELKSNFQGRVFEIYQSIDSFDWKNLRKEFSQAHIIARNYPLSVEQIRLQSKIKEGGEFFLIFTTWQENQKGVIVARKTA